MIIRLDAALGRQPIYRVVTAVLVGLALVAFVLAILGRLDETVFPVSAMALTLVVLLGASVLAGTVLGRLRGIRPHTESAVITALLLWFLYWPATDAAGLMWLALAALLAATSKYLLVWRGRHVFNPAAAGVVLLAVTVWLLGQPTSAPYTTWWVASDVLLVWVVLGGLVILWRLRRVVHSLLFVLAAGVLSWWAMHDLGFGAHDALTATFQSSPIVFFACLMLTEPLTLGPRRRHQVVAAVAAAVVFTLPLTFAAADVVLHTEMIGGTYEAALLVANLIAFAFGQGGAPLEFVGRRTIGDDTVELTFRPLRRLRFVPGQYVELDLGPSGAPGDRRGLRRMLSISSAPGGEMTVAVRIPERPSRFKQALLSLAPGQRVRASAVGGDFTWGARRHPLLLVAGGIGVTPYLSQLRSPAAADADVVLVYGTTADRLPYAAELAEVTRTHPGIRVVVVSEIPPSDMAEDWTHVASASLTAEVIHAAVADLHGRRILVSGPPAMVDALRFALPRARTDHFAGY